MSVYVRWYKQVVEGTVVNENDLFGMVAVRIPIQGVQAVALYHPKNVFKTLQDACGKYPLHFPTPEEMIHLEPQFSVSETVSKAIEESKFISSLPESVCQEYLVLQQFKHDHWDNERNMLQLDYWPEYDRMYHAYQRKRYEMKQTKQTKSMELEHPITPEEAILPMAKPEPPVKYTTVSAVVKPKRTVTIKELSLWD